MSRGFPRLNQPRSNLFRDHFENVIAIRSVLFREMEIPSVRPFLNDFASPTLATGALAVSDPIAGIASRR